MGMGQGQGVRFMRFMRLTWRFMRLRRFTCRNGGGGVASTAVAARKIVPFQCPAGSWEPVSRRQPVVSVPRGVLPRMIVGTSLEI